MSRRSPQPSNFVKSGVRRGVRLHLETLEDRFNPGAGVFNNGLFDFCVSVRFDATPAQLQIIKDAFQRGSDVLADATDGQHRFGKIGILNNSATNSNGAGNASEFWVMSGPNVGNPGSAGYSPLAKYGVRGQHVVLFFDDAFSTGIGVDGHGYNVAHEFGHLAYGLRDQYVTSTGAFARSSPAGSDTAALNYSLMDNYFARGGKANGGTTYTLNEFMVKSQDNTEFKKTKQFTQTSKVDWEILTAQTKFPLTAPAALPVSAAPASQSVMFMDGGGRLVAMNLLDHSGSMSIDNRIEFARNGAKVFNLLVQLNDSIGVASFDDTASLNFPLTKVAAGTVSSANSAIDGISPDGSTNIGGGLQLALDQITASVDRSCNEVIVLLSDGDHNTGTDPLSVIPALKAAGVAVITVGVGTGISSSGQATLQQIATQTGGKYYGVSSTSNLIGLFFQLSMEAQGNGIIARAPVAVTTGQTVETEVSVEDGSTTVTFAVAKQNGSDILDVSLKTPLGDVLTAASPGVTYSELPNMYLFQVPAQTGKWKVVVAGTQVTGTVEMLAATDNSGTQLLVSTVKDTLAYPEAMVVQATPQYQGQNIVGASVTGTVVMPSGGTRSITLYDDGLAIHGDDDAGDGIYSAKFSAYEANGNGTYSFQLTAVSTTGKFYGGESLGAIGAATPQAAPSFVRSGSTNAVITGVPAVVNTGGPLVTSVTVNDGARQRSTVRKLTVTFNSAVAVAVGAFVVRSNAGFVYPTSFTTTLVNGNTVATIVFTGRAGLADGRYALTTLATKVTSLADGQQLDGNHDGVAGGNRTDSFFRLYGDLDGNLIVDKRDEALFNAYRKNGTTLQRSYLDFNYDNKVDNTDLKAFSRALRGR